MAASNIDTFRTLGLADSIPNDFVVPFYLEDLKRRISIARVDQRLYAFDDLCTCGQEACPLSGGLLTGTTIMCQCHGSRFDVTTGGGQRSAPKAATSPPPGAPAAARRPTRTARATTTSRSPRACTTPRTRWSPASRRSRRPDLRAPKARRSAVGAPARRAWRCRPPSRWPAVRARVLVRPFGGGRRVVARGLDRASVGVGVGAGEGVAQTVWIECRSAAIAPVKSAASTVRMRWMIAFGSPDGGGVGQPVTSMAALPPSVAIAFEQRACGNRQMIAIAAMISAMSAADEGPSTAPACRAGGARRAAQPSVFPRPLFLRRRHKHRRQRNGLSR